jgi:hypothetical protein
MLQNNRDLSQKQERMVNFKNLLHKKKHKTGLFDIDYLFHYQLYNFFFH